MSTQSAALRTASQAAVNNHKAEPVELTDTTEARRTASVAWVPAILIGTWVEFAYVVPAVSHWLAQILA